MFKTAKPITLKLKKQPEKFSAFFAANFDCSGKKANVVISCSDKCKITVNGDFCAYIEPKINGYMIESFNIDISDHISWGLNQIVVELLSKKSNKGFLVSELFADDKLMCATGKNFIGFMDAERFFSSAPVLILNDEEYNRGGVCMIPCDISTLEHEFIYDEKNAEFQYDIIELDNYKKDISKKEKIVIATKCIKNAFFIFDFTALEKTTLNISFSTNKQFTSPVIAEYNFIQGEYQNELFSPKKFKYIKITLKNGRGIVNYVGYREYLT